MFTQPIPFGKYFLLERVNVGGMAEVFKAKTFGVEGFERLLAVKRILPNIAEDSEFIEMFVDEAKIAVELHHANIAQIYDLGRVDGSHYIALEYIHGKDLRAIFDRARKLGEAISIPMACYIVMKICEGIDYAHNKRDPQGREMNLVHRDISPQNILVSYEGEVKIIDFGIAKAANKASKTQAGILKGKFGYMSPEQVRGLPLDRRSDIFSVGIVLYEMLTGERLFLGESDFSTLEKVRNVEIMPPTLHNPKIPDELETIVFKALAKSVDERYENAIDLHDDLQRFLYAMNSFFSRKDLAQHMKRVFNEELARENAQLDAYRRMPPPPGAGQEGQGNYHNGYQHFNQSSGSLAEALAASASPGAGPSRRGPPVPVSARTPLPPGNPSRHTPLPDASGMPPLPSPHAAFQSGFVGQIPAKPSNGGTQVIAEDDILEEAEHAHAPHASGSFFEAARQVQQHKTPPPLGGGVLDDLARQVPPSAPRMNSFPGGSSPNLAPVRPGSPFPGQSFHELLPPEAIPPMSTNPNQGRAGGRTLVGVGLAGVLAVGLALLLYFLFAKPAKGTLVVIVSPGDARIYVDSELQQETSPASLLLTAGLHHVTVTKDGFESAREDVEIVEGQSKKLSINLSKRGDSPNPPSGNGKLYVDSEPAGASIIIDGTPRPEKTPALLEGLPLGSHTIQVVPSDGALTPFVLENYEITADAKTPIKARFDAARGVLVLSSEPSGAVVSVLVPSEKKPIRAATPGTVSDLPLNVELTVAFEVPGAPRVTRSITLKSSEPTPLSVVLSGAPAKPDPAKPDPVKPDPAKPDPVKPDPIKPDPVKPDPIKPDPVKPDPVVEEKGPGTITIGSNPSCEVILDGKSIGYTPVVKYEVKSGSHSIRLKNEKFGIDFSTSVSVAAGEDKKFSKKFDLPATP